MKIEEKFPQIKKNVLLANYTTFGIGGTAKYFLIAEKKQDLIDVIKEAKKLNIPFFVIGGGSNILVADEGFWGLIIKLKMKGVERRGENNIFTKAGVKIDDLVKFSQQKSLTGLEWARGIPGTVAGAVYGNIGAFGVSMKDIVKEVEVFNTEDMEIKKFSKKDCKFSQKDSIFKHQKNLIILSCVLELEKGDKKEITKRIKKYLNYRKENHPLEFKSAGCIFKNYKGEIKNKKLLEKYPQLKKFNQKKEIPAGFLVEKCNLKGKREGGAQISKKHSNFITNQGRARAGDVLKLINLAEKKVKQKFGIKLEREIQCLGFSCL